MDFIHTFLVYFFLGRENANLVQLLLSNGELWLLGKRLWRCCRWGWENKFHRYAKRSRWSGRFKRWLFPDRRKPLGLCVTPTLQLLINYRMRQLLPPGRWCRIPTWFRFEDWTTENRQHPVVFGKVLDDSVWKGKTLSYKEMDKWTTRGFDLIVHIWYFARELRGMEIARITALARVLKVVKIRRNAGSRREWESRRLCASFYILHLPLEGAAHSWNWSGWLLLWLPCPEGVRGANEF